MRRHENRPARRLVYASGFDADQAILDQVHLADTVFAAQLVQRFDQFHTACEFAVQLHRHAFEESDRYIVRLIRRF